MSHLRLRVELNKGKRGISLVKLENIVAEIHKFLTSIGNDLDIGAPSEWIGVDFRNGSLAFTNEGQASANASQVERFNGAIIALAKSDFPPFIQDSTAEQFFAIPMALEPNEKLKIAIYPPDSKKAKWLSIGRDTAARALALPVLPYRESIGSAQGTLHSLYKESKVFYLRELSTQSLIKCFYEEEDYDAIVRCLKVKDQVVNIHGRIVTDTRRRCVRDIRVERIIPADPYTYADVEEFLNSGKTQ